MPLRHAVALFLLLCPFMLDSSAARAQSRAETVEFLFRNSVVNGVWFFNGDPNVVSNYSLTEDNCVVHEEAIATESTTNWGDPPITFSGKPISVTVDFNKLLLNKFIQTGLGIEIKIGDHGAVYGTNWVWKNTNEYGWDHKGIVLERDDFSDDHLIMSFTDPDKDYRALDALKYFVQNFCHGKRSAF